MSLWITRLLCAAVVCKWLLLCSACQHNASTVGQNAHTAMNDAATMQSCVELTVGTSTGAGDVCFEEVDSDGDGEHDILRVCYNTIHGWQLEETQFFIGKSMALLPMSRAGNLVPELFPYKSGKLPGGTTGRCIDIPLKDIGFACPGPHRYAMSAHALVSRNNRVESAWGAGYRTSTHGCWGKQFEASLVCHDTPSESCGETSFARGSATAQCFDAFAQFVTNPLRWGWTNGPLAQGTHTFELYAGADQCDIDKARHTGTVTVVYDGGTASITVNTRPPHTLCELQLYVGNGPLPQHQGEVTLAPAHYPIQFRELPAGRTDWHHNVPGLSGKIYVVAHAVVSGFPCALGNTH